MVVGGEMGVVWVVAGGEMGVVWGGGWARAVGTESTALLCIEIIYTTTLAVTV